MEPKDEVPEEKPKSPEDLVREQREKLKAENDAFEAEKLRAEKLRAEASLAGTAGGHIEPVPAREESPKEYAERVMNNKVEKKE